MIKYLLILFISIFLISCWKIEPIKNYNNTWTTIQEISTWKIDNKEEWIDLNEDVWINLEEEDEITKRFNLISEKYPNHSDLMWSIQYEQFVKYVYSVFEKYKKIWWMESDKTNNYIYERLIPKIVINNYVINWKISEEEAELVIQSIKRNDLNTLEDKKLLTEKFKIYFEEKKFNPFIKNLNTKWMDKNQKMELILQDKNWIFYQILSNRYDWNKIWIWYKPAEMESDLTKYLDSKLTYTLWIIWVSESELENAIYEKYNINSIDLLAKDILTSFNNIVKNYNLEWKIPLERTYRDDEINDIFIDRITVDKYIENLSNWKTDLFLEEIEDLRLKMYLLSYLWRNRTDLDEKQWLWSSRARSKFIDDKYWDWVQNLFRLSRYIPWEEVKINLDNNSIY